MSQTILDEIVNYLTRFIYFEDADLPMGGGWNGKLLANKHKPWGVGDPELVSIKGKTLRGYRRYQWEDAWKRYL